MKKLKTLTIPMANCDGLQYAFGADECDFNLSGLDRIALIIKDRIASTSADGDGKITGMTLTSGSTFNEVFFVEQSGFYTDEYQHQIGSSTKYMQVNLSFIVGGNSQKSIKRAEEILLARKQVALCLRKNGSWYLVGLDCGLEPVGGTSNSGQKPEDETGKSFTLTGLNRGYSPVVDFDGIGLEALINKATS
jgi:hypothetical protein